MLSKYFKAPHRMQAIRSGPAGALIEGFARRLSEGGCEEISARRHIRAAEHSYIGQFAEACLFALWTRKHSNASVPISTNAAAVAIAAPTVTQSLLARGVSYNTSKVARSRLYANASLSRQNRIVEVVLHVDEGATWNI